MLKAKAIKYGVTGIRKAYNAIKSLDRKAVNATTSLVRREAKVPSNANFVTKVAAGDAANKVARSTARKAVNTAYAAAGLGSLGGVLVSSNSNKPAKSTAKVKVKDTTPTPAPVKVKVKVKVKDTTPAPVKAKAKAAPKKAAPKAKAKPRAARFTPTAKKTPLSVSAGKKKVGYVKSKRSLRRR